jgi:hypothetical protein
MAGFFRSSWASFARAVLPSTANSHGVGVAHLSPRLGPSRQIAFWVWLLIEAETGEWGNPLGEMRATGVTGLLIYCSDYRCSHHIAISAESWANEVRLSDLEPRFVCKACGRRGADIRPNFAPARMGTRAT